MYYLIMGSYMYYFSHILVFIQGHDKNVCLIQLVIICFLISTYMIVIHIPLIQR